eukprot:6212559-Pleurochrysis_carterae.AAC.7
MRECVGAETGACESAGVKKCERADVRAVVRDSECVQARGGRDRGEREHARAPRREVVGEERDTCMLGKGRV